MQQWGMHGRGHVWKGHMHGGGGACVTEGVWWGTCGRGVCMVGGMHGRWGMCGRGVCMVGGMHCGGCAWQGGMHGRGHALQRVACMAGGACVVDTTTGWPRHRENREFGSYFFQTGKTQGIWF